MPSKRCFTYITFLAQSADKNLMSTMTIDVCSQVIFVVETFPTVVAYKDFNNLGVSCLHVPLEVSSRFKHGAANFTFNQSHVFEFDL